MRTKKEILDENGNLREGCSIISKGEVYESHLFDVKIEHFKSKAFTREVKEMYTKLMNQYVKEESQKLSVFQSGGVYLATKKIGKNNPKAAEIRADNAARQEWNRTVDVALAEGIAEETVLPFVLQLNPCAHGRIHLYLRGVLSKYQIEASLYTKRGGVPVSMFCGEHRIIL